MPKSAGVFLYGKVEMPAQSVVEFHVACSDAANLLVCH